MTLHNHVTGEQYKAYIFVATLPFSMYCYAEACLDMKEASWIKAHARMFEFLGGSTRILVPDNLKTGIISNRKHEDPITNRAYQEMADHYGTVIMPARVLAPKDKAAVEGSVGQITTHIIAKLRNRKFFTLAEMNDGLQGHGRGAAGKVPGAPHRAVGAPSAGNHGQVCLQGDGHQGHAGAFWPWG